jgi:hypothetical protein
MKAIIQIKKIEGKEINPSIFKLPEATMWCDMDFVARIVLQVRRVNSHWEFTRNGITYKVTPLKKLDNAFNFYYSEVEWCSLFEFLFNKSPMI